LKQIPEQANNTELSRLQAALQLSIDNMQNIETAALSQADIASLDSLFIQTRRFLS
jgi:hypothetical protein